MFKQVMVFQVEAYTISNNFIKNLGDELKLRYRSVAAEGLGVKSDPLE